MTSQKTGALHILLQLIRAREPGNEYAFRFEPQVYILPTSGGESPSTRFEWTQDVLADLHALRLPGRDPALVHRTGNLLRSFVKSAGWDEQMRDLAEALAHGRPVSVTIRSSAAELYALPWELLTLRSSQYIGQVDGLLLRYEWPGTESVQEQPRPRPEGGRILVAWSAAGGTVPANAHIQAISRACAAGFHPFHPDQDILANASLGSIAERLEAAERTEPAIAVLHLLCHGSAIGSGFGLCLDGERGPVVVDAAQVAAQLAPFASRLRLIVLSACDSGNSGALGNQLGSVAQALHRCGIQSVMASRYPLSVAGSIELTKSFYREFLSIPASLEAALLAARRHLSRAETSLPNEQRRLDWASVQLYANHQDGDDTRPLVFRPFRGLLAFQPEHRRFFFGRDQEVKEVLGGLQALIDKNKERFLIVAGASGTGKSSLIFAGVVPRLLEQNPQLTLLRMRPGREPESVLDETLRSSTSGTPALLVVDQFEELFTQTNSPAVRESFVRRLWSLAAAPEPGLRVIVTLRVDFIGRCGDLAVNAAGLRLDRVAYDAAYRVFVAQMGQEQLRAAIVEPALRVGLVLEAGLADRILEEVGQEPGALPLLEDTLDLLWQRREGRTLTQAAYAQIGGVIGALHRRADAILDGLSAADLVIAQRLLVSLVAVADDTAQDTRLRVSSTDLARSIGGGDTEGVERVLKQLVTARLLVQDDGTQAATVEVAHEALIRKWPRLRGWLDEDRAGLLVYRRTRHAALQWELGSCDESLLYRGVQLAQVAQNSEWRRSWEGRLGELERRFLQKSDELRTRQEQEAVERQRRETQITRWTRIAVLVLGVLFLGAAGAGFLAKRNSDIARERLLDSWIDRGQQLLFKDSELGEALLWLHRAQRAGSRNAGLPHLIKSAMQSIDMRRAVLREEGDLKDMDLSRDGRRIVTASNMTARVWEAESGRQITALKGHAKRVTCARFSPDSRRIVTASEDSTVRVWEAESGRLLFELNGHAARVQSASFSPDGLRIVTASDDMTARVWEAESGRLLFELKGHESRISSTNFSPDGSRLVTASEMTARIWDAASGRLLHVLGLGRELNPSASFSPDGRLVLTRGHAVKVWEAGSGRVSTEIGVNHGTDTSASFSPDGRLIVTGSRDGVARIWLADSGHLHGELRGHTDRVHDASFSPDGRFIVTASWDDTVRIWETSDARLFAKLEGHTLPVFRALFSPDGRSLITASMDTVVRIWDVQGWRLLREIAEPAGKIQGATFSLDGRRIVTSNEDGTARVWDAENGQPLAALPGPRNSVYPGAFISLGGRRVVTISSDRIARVWDVASGRQLAELKGIEANFSDASFSPDERRIVTEHNDSIARVWDAENGRLLLELKGNASSVEGARFSPDGRRIVTAKGDLAVRVWDAASGLLLFSLEGAAALLIKASFSPDGRRIVATDMKGLARVWDADDQRLLFELRGHEAYIMDASFSPDGLRIVTASADGTARVWDASSGRQLIMLRTAGTPRVSHASFSPDNRRIITVEDYQKVRVWDVSPETRTAAQLAKLLHCHVPREFEREGSDIIVRRRLPDPTQCQTLAPARPSARPVASNPAP